MAVTKQQAMTERHFHAGTCTRVIGPRGAVTERSENWRANGRCKTWVTRPDDFRLPIKYGLKNCAYLMPSNAHMLHAEADCPLKDPAYVTKDNRITESSNV